MKKLLAMLLALVMVLSFAACAQDEPVVDEPVVDEPVVDEPVDEEPEVELTYVEEKAAEIAALVEKYAAPESAEAGWTPYVKQAIDDFIATMWPLCSTSSTPVM